MDAPTDKYLEALRRFAGAGDLKMARSVVRSMEQREVPVEPAHLEQLLQANLTGRDPAGARNVVEQMRTAGVEVDSDVRFDLAITTARSGRLGDAVAELDALHEEGLRPASGQLQELLSIHVRAGRFAAARALLRRLAAEGRGARPQDYEAMFADLHERRAIKDSIAQVELMLEAGTPPSAEQGEGLIEMMAAAGHPDRATQLLDLLLESGVLKSQDTLTVILDGHARNGDAEAVAATVSRMAEAGVEPNSFHRNQMLAARLAAEDVEGAWRMVDQLLDNGRIPSGDNVDKLFDVTLEAGHVRRATGALHWAMILGIPVSPQRIAAAVDGHLQADELPTARWLFDEATRQGVPRDRRAARGIVEETIRSGDLDGARALLSELLSTQTLTHGRHWGSLLRALLGAERLGDAVKVVGELIEAGESPAASDLVRIVHALLDADQPEAALDLTMGALRAGTEADATNFGELLWLFAKPKHVAQTEAVLAWMQERGVEVEHRHLKAVAHAKGEELPDPEPEPAPEPEPEPEPESTPTAAATPVEAPTVEPDGPADWELQIEGAIRAAQPTDEAPTPAEPAPEGVTAPDDEATEVSSEPDASMAAEHAAAGAEPAPHPDAVTADDVDELPGAAPGPVDEQAPVDEHVEVEQDDRTGGVAAEDASDEDTADGDPEADRDAEQG